MQEQEKTQDPTSQPIEAGEPQASESSQAEQASAASSGHEQRLAAAEAKASEMQDAFLRARAEAENIRRRAQDDIAKAHKFAIESFAEALVPVKDSLEMALKLETPSIESLKEGVEMTLKQLSTAFERNRLVEVNPQPGEKLDPMKHQAISMVPAQQEANTIVSVLQKGYMISDRLLRPALVTVAQ
ncbi:molecular chaperone GrpE [Noviherbaspirillum humi]|uniref:Protein GrpE n=1 Tax=Noviherbaspirillum humi TaxID=1688639 RepID=A0A239E617_9BURK|nr:nucleotide exchange factor GrpE [Noviherbaspirillum humi]SNS39463.1 molecular chaperone GrpE [Noviherbaspirillum humi]